jgi:hypothetical protein
LEFFRYPADYTPLGRDIKVIEYDCDALHGSDFGQH